MIQDSIFCKNYALLVRENNYVNKNIDIVNVIIFYPSLY